VLDALEPGASVVVEVAPDRLAERGDSAVVLFETMAELGFAAAALPNDYHPSAYGRRAPSGPVHLDAAPDGITDVVFTKIGGGA
jgi:hypothetical protein